jgi:hypothetical protein
MRKLGEYFGSEIFAEHLVNQSLSRGCITQLFKKSVKTVDVELFSQCNRRCSYCTNSVIDRGSDNKVLEISLYDRLLSDLASIEYDGKFRFIGLNESTLYDNILIPSLIKARTTLPGAWIVLYTNGDNLNTSYLRALEKNGLNEIRMSVHLSPGVAFTEESVRKRIINFAKKNKLDIQFEVSNEVKVSGRLTGYKFTYLFNQENYFLTGHDRGGSITIPRQETRTSACLIPFRMICVAFNGDVFPCCHFSAGVPMHSCYVCGSLKQQDIFQIFSGPSYVSMRRSLLNTRKKLGGCTICSDHADDPLLSSPVVEGLIEIADHIDPDQTTKTVKFTHKRHDNFFPVVES